MDKTRILNKLGQLKLPLLALALGVLILLVPTGRASKQDSAADDPLREVLSSAEGVGEARVLVSEHGVVVVCEGADKAAVKLDILRAVGSYTGFGSDKITILRLSDH